MTLEEYAASRGKSVEDAKVAAEASEVPIVPNAALSDEDIAKLDQTLDVKPPEKQPEKQAAKEPAKAPASKAAAAKKADSEPPKPQDPPPVEAPEQDTASTAEIPQFDFGEPGDDLYLFEVEIVAGGPLQPVTKRGYAVDEGDAKKAVLTSIPGGMQYRNKVSVIVKRVED